MINVIVLIIGLIILKKVSQKISIKDICSVIVMYVIVQVMLGVGFLSENPLLMILFILGYILLNEYILFKYKSKVNMLMYTVIYMIIIMMVPSLFHNIRGYEVGLTNEYIGYLVSMLLVLGVGYINVLEGEYNKYINSKYLVLGIIVFIYLLNSLVYYSYYYADVIDKEVIEISTCKELSNIENNHVYSIKEDIACEGKEVSIGSSILPYRIKVEGNNNTISNLKIKENGLVKINGMSELSNIRFEGLEIEGNGIVGVNYGNIERVAVVDSNINGKENIGGIVGINRGDISDSYSGGNNIKGDRRNIGGIVGENYGGIEHTYSTSYVQGYEYVGGLVGHQGEPGYLAVSFYDDISDEDKISKGALEVIGQDRQTREVMEGLENSEEVDKYYEENKSIIDEAYKIDTQDWYLNGDVGVRTEDNVIVLNQEEYTDYISGEEMNIEEEGKDITSIRKELMIGTVKSIVDELNETRVNSKVIMVLPYYDIYGYTEGELSDGTIVRIYTLENYGFENTIWDYSSLNENKIGESEPIRLKGM